MQEKIINLTGGTQESVSSVTFAIDYTSDIEKAKSIIENILKNHKSVIFNLKRKREIRFIFRTRGIHQIKHHRVNPKRIQERRHITSNSCVDEK